MNIFIKFHKDWTEIVNLMLIGKFLASLNNFWPPSSLSKHTVHFSLSGLLFEEEGGNHILLPNQMFNNGIVFNLMEDWCCIVSLFI